MSLRDYGTKGEVHGNKSCLKPTKDNSLDVPLSPFKGIATTKQIMKHRSGCVWKTS